MLSNMEWRDVWMDKKRYGFLQSETVAHEIQRKLEEITMRVHQLDSAKFYRRDRKYYSIIRVPFKPEDLGCEERLYRCGNNSVITLPSLKPDLTCEEVK